jgi:hypothetical protein
MGIPQHSTRFFFVIKRKPRELQLYQPLANSSWKLRPPLCHPEAKPNFLPRCFETNPRVRFSVGENRMKLANATNTNRKFGKPRDLQFHSTSL